MGPRIWLTPEGLDHAGKDYMVMYEQPRRNAKASLGCGVRRLSLAKAFNHASMRRLTSDRVLPYAFTLAACSPFRPNRNRCCDLGIPALYASLCTGFMSKESPTLTQPNSALGSAPELLPPAARHVGAGCVVQYCDHAGNTWTPAGCRFADPLYSRLTADAVAARTFRAKSSALISLGYTATDEIPVQQFGSAVSGEWAGVAHMANTDSLGQPASQILG